MILKRARNKLRKNGYALRDPVPSTTDTIKGVEVWLDVQENGTPISFFSQGDRVDGAFKVYGPEPDMPQYDFWSSVFTCNLSEAIRLSRVSLEKK